MEDEDFYTFWSVDADRSASFRAETAQFISSLAKHGQVVANTALSTIAHTTPDEIQSFMSISKNIGSNVFNEIGLTKWPEIKPRGVRDKSYLVLKKEGNPKHFREITELINTANFSTRKAHIQTVHNELIKDDRFVLVGRGIYALAEWGYESGTVKEVIASLLRKEGSQTKEQVIAHVMKTRMVKPNTVILGMQDKKLFSETESGHLTLKEA